MKQERLQNFKPLSKGTHTATPAETSANVQVKNKTIRVYNGTNKVVWICIGTGASLAASVDTDTPIPAGGVELFDLINDDDRVAYVIEDDTDLEGKLSIGQGTGN